VLVQSVAIAFADLDCHMWLGLICQSLLWVSFHTCRSLLVVSFHTCWSLLRVLFVTRVVPQSDRAPLPVEFFCGSLLYVSIVGLFSHMYVIFGDLFPHMLVSFVGLFCQMCRTSERSRAAARRALLRVSCVGFLCRSLFTHVGLYCGSLL